MKGNATQIHQNTRNKNDERDINVINDKPFHSLFGTEHFIKVEMIFECSLMRSSHSDL